ncbi:MAG: CPBP family intramembrane metalloprotease [Tenacibaculum sp.]|nr:CPBP family intramembrane metalloprotease [Tenacibaculum sp.]
MNYIQQAYKGEHGFWQYLVMPIILYMVLAISQLFSFFFIDAEMFIKQDYTIIGKNTMLALMLYPFAIGLFVLFIWVKYLNKQSIISLTTSRKKIDWGRVLFSFLLWGGIIIMLTIIEYFISPESFLLNFHLGKFLVMLLISIFLIPLQTSLEEYFFRGFLMQGIGKKFKSRFLPLIITSVIFGLMHMANPEVEKMGEIIMIYYIGTGLFLGVITLMDEGLELALGFHCANNLIGALLVTSDWTALQTNSILIDVSEPSLLFSTILPVFVVFPIVAIIFAKKYGWTNWKEKLIGKIEKPTEIINE